MLMIDAPEMTAKDWADAREFCLATIKEVYNIDYRVDWHKDLDDMLGDDNVYLPQNGGWFVLARDEKGAVIASAGLRALGTRPALYAELKSRWPDSAKIGGMWRSYVRKDYRGRGIGRAMKERRIEKAKELGYTQLYLHASKTNPVAIMFGEKFGFVSFKEDKDGTVHMDMKL